MKNDWEIAMESISKITVFSNPNNESVTISGETDNMKCIGMGTDAAVFQSPYAPAFAFKKYAKEVLGRRAKETKQYKGELQR